MVKTVFTDVLEKKKHLSTAKKRTVV